MSTSDAYAAGLIDGEGCIAITQNKNRPGSDGLFISVDIGMTVRALPILRGMQTRYGGNVRRSRGADSIRAEAWEWTLRNGPGVRACLTAVLPYLQLKAEHARLMLTFLDLRDSLVPAGGTYARWTPEARARAARMVARSHELNAKGPAPEPPCDGWIAQLAGGRWVKPQGALFADLGSDEFSETWPKRGSMRNGVCYERQMSAHPMAELESLLLPTPTAGDSKGSRNSTAHRNKIPPTGIHPGDTLTDAAWKLLPMPTARDGKAGPDYRKRTEGDDLYQAASRIGDTLTNAAWKLLPTPTARLGMPRGAQAARYTNPERSNDLDDAIAWMAGTGRSSHPLSSYGNDSPDAQLPFR